MIDTLAARVRTHAVRTPHAVAIEEHGGAGARTTTYAQLWEATEALATRLVACGLGSGDVVASTLPKSTDWVVALLGVMHAGCVCVPVPPTLPGARRTALLRDAAPAALLEQSGAGDGIAITRSVTASAVPRADAAYIMFTSGSTGSARGVVVEHAPFLGVLDAQVPLFDLAAETGVERRVLFFLSTAFDASLSDVGTALVSGSTLVIDAAAHDDIAGLLGALTRHRITHLDIPPSVLRLVAPEQLPRTLRVLVVGGEASAPGTLVAHARLRRVVAVYGPTEATICSHAAVVDARWDRAYLGAPLPGVVECVVNGDGHVVADREAGEGELLLLGSTLARGYLQPEDPSAARFIVFRGQRAYRTGDVVRRTPGQMLEFRGRADRQIKLHGQRIEIDAIEAVGRGLAALQHFAVVKRTEGQRDLLVAYCAPHPSAGRGGDDALAAQVRAHLAARLPAHEVPARIVVLPELPLLPSGKVDLAALAQRSDHVGDTAVPPSETPASTAWALQEILAQTLGHPVDPGTALARLALDSYARLVVVAAAAARGIHIPPAALDADITVQELAARVAAGPSLEVMSTAELAKRAAAAVAAHGAAPARVATVSAQPSMRRVLFTGATGMLGSHSVAALLAHGDVDVTVLVRGAATGAQERAAAAALRGGASAAQVSRLKALAGDVTHAHIPASDGPFDVVVHCAADTNVTRALHTLWPTNVDGAIHARRWALAHGAAFVHVSTLSVFASTNSVAPPGQDTVAHAPDDDIHAATAVYGGYAQSKWAAEHALGLLPQGNVAILRFGLILNDTPVNHGVLHTDLFTAFVRALARIGAVPAAALDALWLDATPLSRAAVVLAEAARQPVAGRFHIAAPAPARLRTVVEAIAAAAAPVAPLGTEAFVSALTWAPLSAGERALVRLCLGRLWTDPAACAATDLFLATGHRFSAPGAASADHHDDDAPAVAAIRRAVRVALAP